MRSKLFGIFGVLVLIATLGVSQISAQTGPHAFETVDRVELMYNGNFVVTGILAGDSQASTHEYSVQAIVLGHDIPARCERMALLAMEKPGRYVLEVAATGTNLSGCALRRATN